MNIAFELLKLKTTIYVKLKAPDPLLLSESVCQKLGITQYHSLVSSHKSVGKDQEQAVCEKKQVYAKVEENTAKVNEFLHDMLL